MNVMELFDEGKIGEADFLRMMKSIKDISDEVNDETKELTTDFTAFHNNNLPVKTKSYSNIAFTEDNEKDVEEDFTAFRNENFPVKTKSYATIKKPTAFHEDNQKQIEEDFTAFRNENFPVKTNSYATIKFGKSPNHPSFSTSTLATSSENPNNDDERIIFPETSIEPIPTLNNMQPEDEEFGAKYPSRPASTRYIPVPDADGHKANRPSAPLPPRPPPTGYILQPEANDHKANLPTPPVLSYDPHFENQNYDYLAEYGIEDIDKLPELEEYAPATLVDSGNVGKDDPWSLSLPPLTTEHSEVTEGIKYASYAFKKYGPKESGPNYNYNDHQEFLDDGREAYHTVEAYPGPAREPLPLQEPYYEEPKESYQSQLHFPSSFGNKVHPVMSFNSAEPHPDVPIYPEEGEEEHQPYAEQPQHYQEPYHEPQEPYNNYYHSEKHQTYSDQHQLYHDPYHHSLPDEPSHEQPNLYRGPKYGEK